MRGAVMMVAGGEKGKRGTSGGLILWMGHPMDESLQSNATAFNGKKGNIQKIVNADKYSPGKTHYCWLLLRELEKINEDGHSYDIKSV